MFSKVDIIMVFNPKLKQFEDYHNNKKLHTWMFLPARGMHAFYVNYVDCPKDSPVLIKFHPQTHFSQMAC